MSTLLFAQHTHTHEHRHTIDLKENTHTHNSYNAKKWNILQTFLIPIIIIIIDRGFKIINIFIYDRIKLDNN